ncbi:MAG: inlJ [Bacteroidetes bacterium]|nr:inlJ [Bacteroidota bacterium]
MKRLITLTLFGLFTHCCFSQLTSFNPFPGAIDCNGSAAPVPIIATDTSGVVWLAAFNSTDDSIYVVNEYGTIRYTISIGPYAPGTGARMTVDSRNDLWVNVGSGYSRVWRIHNGQCARFLLDTPASTNDGLIYDIVDDHRGADYFLYELSQYDYSQHIVIWDSVFLYRYDGNALTRIPINNIVAMQAPANPDYQLFSDFSGNIYLTDSLHTHKYDGQQWSTYSVNLLSYYYTLPNNLLFNYDGRIFYNDELSHIYIVDSTGLTTPIPDYNYQLFLPESRLFLNNRDSSIYLYQEGGGVFRFLGDTFARVVSYANGATCISSWGAVAAIDRDYNFIFNGCCTPLMLSYQNLHTINGTVFIDTDQDGVADAGEQGVVGQVVSQMPDNAACTTDTGGRYAMAYLTLSPHTVSYIPPAYYHLTSSGTDSLQTGSIAMCCYNFGIAPNGPIQDLQITAAAGGTVRGYDSYHWLSYSNDGTLTMSDTIVYGFDPHYSYLGATPAADVVQGHTAKWAYSNLAPFGRGNIEVALHLDTTAQSGTMIYDTAMILPIAADSTPSNNVYGFEQIVVSSFDPNHKAASPEGVADTGQVLTYSVYFQNTGSSPAVNIVVYDTLDTDLDFSTFKLLGNSDLVSFSMQGKGIVKFTFDNINLPDSASDPVGSQGYVRYSIRTRHDMPYGSDITNTAYIYFDFNSAVATNTTSNFYGTTSIRDITAASTIHIYPNPSTGLFNITGATAGQTINVYDVTGELIMRVAISSTSAHMDVNSLPSGLYMIHVMNMDGSVSGFGKVILIK